MFNHLTQSEVVTKDGLFITLDSTLRKVDPEQGDYLVSDTVGFIDKLPHDLIKAFKTTLMEVETADLLLHVVDVSNHNYEAQITVVNQVLMDIGAGNKKVMMVYNKIDKLTEADREAFLLKNQEAVDELTLYISAKEKLGVDILFEAVSRVLVGEKKRNKAIDSL